jgi:uncharacterized protein
MDAEKSRVFCGHGLGHLLDVARIAYILCLEEGLGVGKELVYAAALLHDTGRWRQYEDGTPHERESADIAAVILPGCGFDDEETTLIMGAILSHRRQGSPKSGLEKAFYRADKLSRRCFDCNAAEECEWSAQNSTLEY